jgi:hypothetical protein
VLDRNEVHAARLGTEDGEEVDLAFVCPASGLRVSMVPVAAARGEEHRALPEPPRLALHTRQSVSVVDHQVIARVLAERHEKVIARLP